MSRQESDLSLTVRELSNAYEELSLLYRISDMFSLLSVEDICKHITAEATSTIGAHTAAVLFLDERGETLTTKTARGNWPSDRTFSRDNGLLWNVIESRKPSAFCSLNETEYRALFPGYDSLMVCPLVGKARVIGVVVVADKTPAGEFYSNDSKLLMAISAQAGMAIENAFLYRELEALLLGAIRSLVKALEATSYWTAGHTERVTDYAIGIGRCMGLGSDMIEKLRISALLHDIGKIATPKEILNKEGVLHADEWVEMKRHPGLGADILVELRQFTDIIESVKYHHEYWDGSRGIYGLKEEEIPLLARILSVADAFDAMTSTRPYRRMKSKDEAIEEIRRCSGSQFDPVVVEAFCGWVNTIILRHQAPLP